MRRLLRRLTRLRAPCLLAGALVAAAPAPAGPSIFTARPDDPQAVDAGAPEFAARGDGVADDTAALQAAIDRVQATARRGIVFVPSGRYRLTRELQVWSGIRLIGCGATRPVFVLGEHTPGYQEGPGKYLVHFVSERPAAGEPVRDANPGTFYSAMMNIDLEIRDGNPAAVGVRAHFAQHCFLAHMDFRIGQGRAGVEEVGNEFSDLRFFGGDFGLTMHKPSPSWPFVLLDTEFTGQRRAAIESEEGGLTLVRITATDTPTVVSVRPGRSEELYVADSHFERITGPVLEFGDDTNARTQVNAQRVTCLDAPVWARLRESRREVTAPAPAYRVEDFTHGLQYADAGAAPELHTTAHLVPLATFLSNVRVASDVAPLPPMHEWTNVRTLGLRGDGATDDTLALRRAVAEHRVLYFPSGRYRITDTITLQPDSVLIGLNPITTQILLQDFTPAFQGAHGPTERPNVPELPGIPRAWRIPPPFPGRGAPQPMIEAPAGGAAIVSGLGLDTGGVNNRAVALKWMSGPNSLVDDVRFLGGHGTYGADGRYLSIYNDQRTADPDPQRKWDAQFWSLWVTNGGGGTFRNLWTPSPFAAAGMYVSETTTPGRVYALSSEHHVRNEVKLRRVANWRFYALQTEAERGESPAALPLEIENCTDLLFANSFLYRVDLPEPFVTGIRVTNSRRLDFRGLHVYSPGKLSFDNTLVDATRSIEVRAREIARLQVPADPGAAAATVLPAVVAGAPVRVATGFRSIDGLVAGPAGEVYFVDALANRIHRWSAAGGLTVATDAIPQPVALALDRSGGLLVVARHGNVYAWRPGAPEETIQVVEPVPAAPRPGAVAWVPASRWRDGHDWLEANTRREPWHYVSPDGSIFIPAPENFPARPGRRGWGTIDLARTYALVPAAAGSTVFVADEFGQTTWSFSDGADGTLSAPHKFAEEGEAGTVVDAAGNVYVCAGHVFVYDRAGRLLGTIAVPERPAALALGGADGRTLFIAARTSLYAVTLRAP